MTTIIGVVSAQRGEKYNPRWKKSVAMEEWDWDCGLYVQIFAKRF